MITIPQGGTVAGRSADIRIERPDVGGFVAQAAGAVAQKMGQIDQEQRAVRMSRAKIEMTKEMGQEYQRISQLGDPAAIDAEWPQAEAAIRARYIDQKDDKGRPVWRPDEADALGLTAMDLGSRHALALGERNITLHQSQQTADWLETRADLTTAAATADPVTMETLLQEGYARIDAQVAQGLMLPDKGVEAKQALEAEVMNARLITAIDQDPAAAAAAIEAGTYKVLGPEANATRLATAQAELDRRAAAAASQAEADARTRSDAIDKRLREITGMEAKTLKASDRDEVVNASPEVQASPAWAEARAAIDLNDKIPDLDLKTVAELDALIAAEAGKTYDFEWQANYVTVLKAKREKLATEVATDPKAAAIARGVIAPKGDLTFDPANPAPFAAALQEAVSQDDHLAKSGFAATSAIFTKDQKAALKDQYAAAEPQDKVAMLATIIQSTSGNVGPVLTALEADPLTRRSTKYLALTGNADITAAMLRGQQKLDAKPPQAITISANDQTMAFDEKTGGVFDDAPVAVREEIMAAANALYADRAKGIDPTDLPTEALAIYERALFDVLGAQATRRGDYTIGGLQEVNGQLTVLPVGVPVAAVETAWETLSDQFYDTPDDPAAPPMQAFQAASHYGGLPDLGTDPGGRLGTLTLRRVGESDIYELVREEGGRLITVQEVGRDINYRFRLRDLLRGVKP